MNTKAYWDNKHKKALPQKGVGVTEFGEMAESFFDSESRILDLGTGAGMDAIYFAKKGHEVIATDISDTALDRVREDIPSELQDKIKVEHLDLAKPFLHPDESFEAVYASVSINYFDQATTDQIFKEIHRILKPGGILAILTNSKSDKEYGTGRKISEDYFEVREGFHKSYFSMEDLAKRMEGKYEILVLDESERVHSDGKTPAIRTRLIARKL